MVEELLLEGRDGLFVGLERFGGGDRMLIAKGIVHVDIVVHSDLIG